MNLKFNAPNESEILLMMMLKVVYDYDGNYKTNCTL